MYYVIASVGQESGSSLAGCFCLKVSSQNCT